MWNGERLLCSIDRQQSSLSPNQEGKQNGTLLLALGMPRHNAKGICLLRNA